MPEGLPEALSGRARCCGIPGDSDHPVLILVRAGAVDGDGGGGGGGIGKREGTIFSFIYLALWKARSHAIGSDHTAQGVLVVVGIFHDDRLHGDVTAGPTNAGQRGIIALAVQIGDGNVPVVAGIRQGYLLHIGVALR